MLSRWFLKVSELTYRQLGERSDRVASQLQELGRG